MIFWLNKRKESGCRFEEWDKKKKKMGFCGKATKIRVGRKYVCLEHLEFVMTMDDNCVPKLDIGENKKVTIPRSRFIKFLQNGKT